MMKSAEEKMLEEWEVVIELVDQHAAELTGVQVHRDRLVELYREVRIGMAVRDALIEAMSKPGL